MQRPLLLNTESPSTVLRDSCNGFSPQCLQSLLKTCRRKAHWGSSFCKRLNRPLSVVRLTAADLDIAPLDFLVEESGSGSNGINQLIREGHYEADLVQKQVTDATSSPCRMTFEEATHPRRGKLR
jgi:hypothetical protein